MSPQKIKKDFRKGEHITLNVNLKNPEPSNFSQFISPQPVRADKTEKINVPKWLLWVLPLVTVGLCVGYLFTPIGIYSKLISLLIFFAMLASVVLIHIKTSDMRLTCFIALVLFFFALVFYGIMAPQKIYEDVKSKIPNVPAINIEQEK